MNRPLHRIGFHNRATCLVSEQVDSMGSVVPKQMVSPATWLPKRIHIGASEEIGLHIHLLDIELPCFHFVVHILVAGVKAACVPTHGDQPFFFGQNHHRFSVFPTVC